MGPMLHRPNMVPMILRHGLPRKFGKGSKGLADTIGVPIAGVYLYSDSDDALASSEVKATAFASCGQQPRLLDSA